MSIDLRPLSSNSFLLRVEQHDEIGSTNDRAADLARDAATPLPALIVAARQTAGRGRGANRWWSAQGALTFSLLVDATPAALPAERWPLVSLATGLAICEALRPLVPAAALALKWPNDVYLSGRKLCGILVEAPPVRPERLIVGIGLNVNNTFEEAPEEVRRRATSLVDVTGRRHDLSSLLGVIVELVGDLLGALAAGDLATGDPTSLSLSERWAAYCLLTGRMVKIDAPHERVAGLCEGIDATGALLVRDESGLRRCVAGVVTEWS